MTSRDRNGDNATAAGMTSSGARRAGLPSIDTSAQQNRRSDSTSNATDVIFEHLSRIQSLQAEITAEHSALEKINTSATSSSGAGQAAATDQINATDFAASPDKRARADGKPGASAAASKGKAGGNADAKGAKDAYDELAAAFGERQQGVDSIMDKLAHLSQAVKAFHTLPPPVLFADSFASSAGPGRASTLAGASAADSAVAAVADVSLVSAAGTGPQGRGQVLGHLDMVETPTSMTPTRRLL